MTVGAGGALVSAANGNHATVQGGSGVSTLFGGSGGVVDYISSLGGGIFVAGTGGATLNAAGSSASDTLSGGNVAGNVSMVGGSGDDTFFAGNGSDTMTGNAGSNIFAFFATTTAGQTDVITDFNANDAVYLIGYSAEQTASALQNVAVVNASGVTLTLSDQTEITFSNLTSEAALNGRILAG